jgi:hypothetical protein
MAAEFDDIHVDAAKLHDYCLSDRHPRGRHKARVFRSRLGLSAADTSLLRDVLIAVARDDQNLLRATDKDIYGQRYMLDFEMETEVGTATIRSSWIVKTGEKVLRFITCYVL